MNLRSLALRLRSKPRSKAAAAQSEQAPSTVDGMGQWLSSRGRDVHLVAKQEITDALVKSKLIDLRAHKKNRDELLAIKMAVGRDQLHFSLGFYASMVAANVFRVIRYRRVELLPINYIPFAAGPFIFLYNVDASYGNKVSARPFADSRGHGRPARGAGAQEGTICERRKSAQMQRVREHSHTAWMLWRTSASVRLCPARSRTRARSLTRSRARAARSLRARRRWSG